MMWNYQVNESKRVLFAFLKDALNINGIPSLLVISSNFLAISIVSSFVSIIQGPATKKKLFSLSGGGKWA